MYSNRSIKAIVRSSAPASRASRWLALPLLILILLLATGCGSTVGYDLNIYDDQSFELVGTVNTPQQVVSLAGGPAAIESQLNRMVQQVRQQGGQGTEANWKLLESAKSGDLAYEFIVKGKGFTNLNRAASISVQETQHQGKKALLVRLPYGSSPMAQGMGFNLTLHAAEVLQSNGTPRGDGRVSWSNPKGDMQATIVPRSRLGIGSVLPWLLVLLLAGGGFAYYRYVYLPGRAPGSSPAPGLPMQQTAHPATRMAPAGEGGTHFCMHCGKPASGARFCPSCGKPV